MRAAGTVSIPNSVMFSRLRISLPSRLSAVTVSSELPPMRAVVLIVFSNKNILLLRQYRQRKRQQQRQCQRQRQQQWAEHDTDFFGSRIDTVPTARIRHSRMGY
jgi:uncharacterized protein involved in propanediol utilization